MITAMSLHAGHVIVQPVGVARSGGARRQVYRRVREVELVAANGGGDWVRALVDEHGGYPFWLYYPPNWPVEIYTTRPRAGLHRPMTNVHGGPR